MRHQPDVLNHIANAAAQFDWINIMDVFTIDSDIAASWNQHTVDHSQGRRLATARGPDKTNEFSTLNAQIDIFNSYLASRINLGDVLKFDHWWFSSHMHPPPYSQKLKFPSAKN